MQPETLADVKAGDEVVVFPSFGGYRSAKVKRVTKWQIILNGGDHYSRHDGYSKDRVSAWTRSRAFIAIGEAAKDAKKERTQHRLRSEAAHELGVPVERFNQEVVITKRAACDKAEAALRELGEWTKPA